MVTLVETMPLSPHGYAEPGPGPGPPVYSARLFLKALVLRSVCHLPTVGALLAVLEEPAMQEVRALLHEQGR